MRRYAQKGAVYIEIAMETAHVVHHCAGKNRGGGKLEMIRGKLGIKLTSYLTNQITY